MTEQEILNEELEILKAEIIRNHENAKQIASGATRNSLEVVTRELSGQLLGASYFGVLETGRKPGGVPRDFIDILKRWAAAKGISFSDEKQFNMWANAVKWKIIREGTKLYRSGSRQDIFTSAIDSFETRLANRIASFYQAKVMNEIFNF